MDHDQLKAEANRAADAKAEEGCSAEGIKRRLLEVLRMLEEIELRIDLIGKRRRRSG